MIIKIKKKWIAMIIISVLGLSTYFCLSIAKPSMTNKFSPIIVIDAGHGGSDGGSVSPFSGIDENHINLEYAKTLQQIMQNIGFKVVMTRENLNGLYPLYSSNRKKDDMKKRKQIIQKSDACLVVSIHMNSFPLQSCFGCQTFYNPENQASIILATNIQEMFKKNLSNARKSAQSGDYFILNCTDKPSVLIECGFLSNKEEEKLLQTDQYRNTLCTLVAYGIILTLN